ncbi:MAG: hypothetical protein WCJ09_19150 [Planctomycetota bacterium]
MAFSPVGRRFFSLALTGLLAALGGTVQASEGTEQGTLVKLGGVFTDAAATDIVPCVSNDLSSSPSSLVSLEAVAPGPALETDPQASAKPIYTMTQPGIQLVDGGPYAGPSSTGGTWVLIAPYGWIAGMKGEVGIGNRVLNIDLTPGRVLQHLGDVDGALMLHTEVGRGNLGFILDGNLIRASTSVSTAPAQIDVTFSQTLLEGLGMYRAIEMPDFLVEGKSLTVDFLAGGRYYQFSNGFAIYPVNPALPPLQTNLTATWVDLVLGVRTRVPVTNSLDAFARVDAGGFGISSSSTMAWNLIAGVDYKMTANSSLIAGYRQLDINKQSYSGTQPFDFNARLYGPFMALAFQF